MPTLRYSAALALGLAFFAVSGVAAQRTWEEPQDPCNVKTGHFLVNGGMMHLKVAIETDNDRTRQERLEKAQEVILRAIKENNQADNPGAWYYLGRTYVEREDPYGADSAFAHLVALMPECETAADRYLARLQPAVRIAALEAWQAGAVDSAAGLLRLAASLAPDNPDVRFLQARLYADNRQFDSASKYVELGIERAAGDTAYEQRQQQVLLQILRGREAAAFESPSIQAFAETRLRRDSIDQAIQNEDARLQTLIEEWAGKNLRPETQQAVSRDSTMLAERVAAGRRLRTEIDAQAARDSAAAATAFAGTFSSYEQYLARYPDDADAMMSLLRRYSLIGDVAGIQRMIRRVADLAGVDPAELTRAGTTVFNDGHPSEAAELLEISASRNPYMQSTLQALSRAYYTLRDGAKLQATAARLVEIDPLNPVSLRMAAAGWDLAGQPDSVARYVALADSGIGLAVTVTQMVPAPASTTLNGSIQNVSAQTSPPATIAFEFLDASGAVLGDATVEVPALEPRRRHAFSASADVGDVAAWRYRRAR